MEIKLAFGITKHSFFGYVCIPYLLEKNDDKEFLTFASKLHKSDFKRYDFLQKEWIKTIFDYSNHFYLDALNKRYNKKYQKLSFNNFFEKLELQEKKVIQKQIDLYKDIIVKNIIENKPLVFLYDRNIKNYYKSDFLKYNSTKLDLMFHFYSKKHDTETNFMYKLQVLLDNKPIPINKTIVLNNTNSLLVYKDGVYTFKQNEFNGNKIKPFQNKNEIIIPFRLRETYFNNFVKYAINKFPYQLNGLNVKVLDAKFIPVLDVETDIKGQFIFSLSFIYKDKKVPFYSSQKIFSKVVNDKNDFVVEQIFRDFKKENNYIKLLKTLDFELKDKYFILESKHYNKYDILKKSEQRLKKLQQLGFRVNNRLLRKKSVFEQGKIASKIKLTRDWFDITITVKIKDFVIPFIAFRQHILDNNQEYVLPDDTIFIIPKEWFYQLSDFAKRVTKNNKIKLHQQSYQVFENQSIINLEASVKNRIKKLKEGHKIEIPKATIATLRPYQAKGFKWLYSNILNNFGVCLADDMGLGKTLQVITVLQRFYEDNSGTQPSSNFGQLDLFSEAKKWETSLIVLPRVLIQNWKIELQKFAPNLDFSVYYGPNRKDIFENSYSKKQLILSSYSIVRNDIDFLKNHHFSFVILDESQTIKNPKSKLFKSVIQLQSDYKLSITGTPFENKLSDIWAQFHFLNAHLLGYYSFFKNEYILKIKNNSNAVEVQTLKKLIKPFILRRLKEEVAKDLPDKMEQTIFCEMEDAQKSFYIEEKSAIRNEILKKGLKKNKINILSKIMHLRQIALHPNLVKKDMESGKFLEIIMFIENLIAQKSKFIIFSSYVKFLDLFKAYFEDNSIAYNMLTGKSKNPQDIVASYERETEVYPFLISIKAGGVGLNITSANYVLITDPWWNPFVEQQAIDRTHRIGQTKNVFVFRFISKDTIEEKIQKIQSEKLNLSDALLNENTIDLSNDTIMELFD